MSRNVIEIRASPDAVFDVLDDARAYSDWVVGARRIRHVDDDWPAVGSRFHHAVGTAAGELHDFSRIIERERPSRLVLEVRFRPTGVARVELVVSAHAIGSEVVITEEPTAGPAAWLPWLVTDPPFTLRNAVSLQRLRHEVERRAEAAAGTSPD